MFLSYAFLGLHMVKSMTRGERRQSHSQQLDVLNGSIRDAVLFGIGCNTKYDKQCAQLLQTVLFKRSTLISIIGGEICLIFTTPLKPRVTQKHLALITNCESGQKNGW